MYVLWGGGEGHCYRIKGTKRQKKKLAQGSEADSFWFRGSNNKTNNGNRYYIM